MLRKLSIYQIWAIDLVILVVVRGWAEPNALRKVLLVVCIVSYAKVRVSLVLVMFGLASGCLDTSLCYVCYIYRPRPHPNESWIISWALVFVCGKTLNMTKTNWAPRCQASIVASNQSWNFVVQTWMHMHWSNVLASINANIMFRVLFLCPITLENHLYLLQKLEFWVFETNAIAPWQALALGAANSWQMGHRFRLASVAALTASAPY